MHLFRKFGLLAALTSCILILGCSSGNSIVTPDNMMESTNNTRDFGLMGAYELTINPDNLTAELVVKRTSAIGESWIVNGISYFTIAPCHDCLAISGFDITPEGDLALVFSIRHPFESGDILKPPSAANRLDLDVFDVAMVIAPGVGTIPTTFPMYYEKIYDGICVNPDGYTMDLFEITEDNAAMPYFLVVDETETDPVPSPTKWNIFEMGSTHEFDAVFNLESETTLIFDMYLTMGYGHSAVKLDRLFPKYYNPEFNRKAAWKVTVTPPEGDETPDIGNTWDDYDSATYYDVKVEVYDWQTGATVSTETDFADADPSHVYASSVVSAVHVEIAGMAANRSTLTVDDGTGTGMPGSPLVYNVPVRNENLLPMGEYPGLVTVVDDRVIGDPDIDSRDYLINCPDGATLDNYMIPAFQTYQTFTATVVVGFVPCTNQELFYDFLECTGPSNPVYNCQDWVAGGCGMTNTDTHIPPIGNFLWGCATPAPLNCLSMADGYLTTGSDQATCNNLNHHGADADYNVVSPEITLPVSDSSSFEFEYCSEMSGGGNIDVYISLNGCSGPWISIMSTIWGNQCTSTWANLAGYDGETVMFRIQYTRPGYSIVGGGSCGNNAGVVIDNIKISGCYYGDLVEN